MSSQITNYQCPACTGPLHYSGSTGKMECDYCGSSYTVEEINALYAAADEQAAEAKTEADTATATAAAAAAADEWAMSGDEMMSSDGMKTYSCPSCGAELICEETMGASSCPYCGNPTIVPGQFTGMLQPDYVIPFKYEKEQAVEALKKHYGSRFLLPKTFKDQNHLEEVKGVYVPFWLYDGQAAGSCRYEAKKSNTVRRGNEEITTTRIFDVERSGSLAFKKIPADASSHMDDALMDSIEPYSYNDLKPFTKAYLTGYLADKYDVSAEENAERAVSRAKVSTRDALRNDVTGYDTVSQVSENIHVEQGKVSYAMMPVWLLTTKWNDKNYTFAMNGQTGKMVGDLPVNTGKLVITSIMIFAVLSAILIGLAELSVGLGIGISVAVTAIVALVLASSMKSVAKAVSANAYIKQDSVRITYRNDRFVRQEIMRRMIEQPQQQPPRK